MRILIFLLMSIVGLADLTCYQTQQLNKDKHPEPEYVWSQDPKFLKNMFKAYRVFNCESYGFLIIKNWLVCNPYVEVVSVRELPEQPYISLVPSVDSFLMSPFSTVDVGSITMIKGGRQFNPLEIGDLNFDGIVNYVDWNIWAVNDTDVFAYKEPSLVDIVEVVKLMF